MEANGAEVAGTRAFGWAVGFETEPAAGAVQVRFSSQWVRTLEMALLALFWLVALWVTRKPVSSA